MSKQSSYPYVIVSEFSRQAAKALDESRDNWHLIKMSDMEFGAIPVGDEFQVSDIEIVDHVSLLSDGKNLQSYYLQTVDETNKLQRYFGGLKILPNNRGATIWGKWVNLDTYKIHRKAIVSLLDYKKLLQIKLKMAMVEYNRPRVIIGAAQGEVKRIASYHAGKDVELINGLYQALATCAKIYGFSIPEKFDSVLEAAKDRVDHETYKYMERVGRQKIDDFIRRLDKSKASTRQVADVVNRVLRMSISQVESVLTYCDGVLSEKQDSEDENDTKHS